MTPSWSSERSSVDTYASTFGRTYEFIHAVNVRSYSRNSGSTSDEIVTGKSGWTEWMISLISRSCAAFAYELISETVSDSTPESTSSRTIVSTWARSTGSTTSP